jgi:hypothetical protein
MVFFFSSRPLLKALKKAGETHIVLDCPVERIYSVMEQALQVGMLTEYHNYFITSLVSIFQGNAIVYPQYIKLNAYFSAEPLRTMILRILYSST